MQTTIHHRACRGLAVVTFAIIALFATKVEALTLLDQAPTGTAGVFSDESFDIFLYRGHSQSVAENFEVITNGEGFLLEEVVVWGGFEPFPGSSFPSWNDVDVLVHADDGGLPGTVLCSERGVVALREATGSQVGGRDEYMVTLTLFSPCGLSDGSYWIEVYYNTGYGYDDWFWEFGTVDPVFGLPDAAFAEENPGVTWDEINVAPFNEVAVKLNGTLGPVTCVASAAELQSALSDAGANGEHDVIQVVEGIYPTSGARFVYVTSESFDLQLLGGFNPSCTDRTIAPANTILDAGGGSPVLAIQPGSSTWGSILVQGFTIRNGVASESETAGLEVAAGAGFTGRITIDHNMILDNVAENGSAGLHAGTDGNLLAVINNLLVGNASSGGHGAGFLSCNGEATFLTNNTVADNNCSACVGGLEVTGTVAPHISNTILWGNEGVDLVFDNPATWLDHNDVGSFTGIPDPGSSGNLSVDPLFIGGGNYRLQIHSPVGNQGTNDPPMELPAFDLDGRQRAKDGHVDMGAYEIPPIFISGFEDPLLGDWTVVVGGGG